MKKIIIVTLIAIIFGSININAQDIKFGAKAGLNYAFVTGDNTTDFDPITNFHFGIVAEMKLSDKFSLQPEVLYSGQGANTNIDSEGRITLNYLNIPLMAKYYFAEKWSVEAGPQVGFLLSTKGGTLDYKNLLKSTDVAANFGLGYKLNNGLNFTLRYNHGFSNILNGEGVTGKNRNGVFQLSIGFFF